MMMEGKGRSLGALCVLAAAFLCGVMPAVAAGQATAREALALARKQSSSLRGLKGEARREAQEETLAAFALVVDRFPDAVEEVARARLEIAGLERRLGRIERAERVLADIEASAAPPKIRAAALDLAARIARAARRLDEAEQTWRTLVERHPGETRLAGEARLALIRLAKSRKQWRKARLEAEALLDDPASGWRLSVDAADLLVGIMVARRDWVAAIAKLEVLDEALRERFGSGDESAGLEKALAGMSARRALTPLPEEG